MGTLVGARSSPLHLPRLGPRCQAGQLQRKGSVLGAMARGWVAEIRQVNSPRGEEGESPPREVHDLCGTQAGL